MPWKAKTVMSERKEFTTLAQQGKLPFSQLCRRYGIHRDTGYKWLRRFRLDGEKGLKDHSRRPHSSPLKTSAATETDILAVRQAHPQWGGRKIRRYLRDCGHLQIPAASTITIILRRHGMLDTAQSREHRDWRRFEAPAPNELWQMDFKGHFPIFEGRCHPLTVLDDHSRYALGVEACDSENGVVVREKLTSVFRRYGMPSRMLMDNGHPWGFPGEYTALALWLLRLDVEVIHGRPMHPQTQGKLERFHRTLKAEVTTSCTRLTLGQCQRQMDDWRYTYNYRRPHEALNLEVPASRYQPSAANFPEVLPPVEYGPDDAVRKVQAEGWFTFRNRDYRVSRALRGEPIALRPTTYDGVLDIYYCRFKIGQIDLAEPC